MSGDIWTPAEEAKRLAQRFETVKQADFARTYRVPGGPSMVNQHKQGTRPISLRAALAYAKGFRVPLEEISPRLALLTAQAATASSAPPAAPAAEVVRTQPPIPSRNFDDRHDVSESDFALLQAVKVVIPKRQQKEIIEQASESMAVAREQLGLYTVPLAKPPKATNE